LGKVVRTKLYQVIDLIRNVGRKFTNRLRRLISETKERVDI